MCMVLLLKFSSVLTKTIVLQITFYPQDICLILRIIDLCEKKEKVVAKCCSASRRFL